MSASGFEVLKARPDDFLGRFREVVSDPLNMLIERVPMAGYVEGDQVYLHNGLRVPVVGPGAYYGPFSQLLVINRGVHEPLEEYVFQELLKRLSDEPSMIELGAYWGHYSMWLKKARPKGNVILVEPDPGCLKAGQDNFVRNGLKGEFIRAFVGSGKFEVDAFFRTGRSSGLTCCTPTSRALKSRCCRARRVSWPSDVSTISSLRRIRSRSTVRSSIASGYRAIGSRYPATLTSRAPRSTDLSSPPRRRWKPCSERSR